jgi:hypothetical protein
MEVLVIIAFLVDKNYLFCLVEVCNMSLTVYSTGKVACSGTISRATRNEDKVE